MFEGFQSIISPEVNHSVIDTLLMAIELISQSNIISTISCFKTPSDEQIYSEAALAWILNLSK